MPHYPLNVLLDSNSEVVLINGEIIAGLTAFELDVRAAAETLKTNYTCVNCFPRPSGHRIPDLGKYPLHVYVGDTANDILVSHEGKPIGDLRALQVKLSTTKKRIIQLTAYTALPEELETSLLDLGVEIIVMRTPFDLSAKENANANL